MAVAFLLAFTGFALFIIGVTTIANLVMFPRLGARTVALLPDTPLVSILIPARNEAGVIGQTVTSLLDQTYRNLEILILDDQSTDGTAAIAQAAAEGNSSVRVLPGEPLPSGWLGKNWACQQLAAAARGEFLVFTDADVQWQPDAVATLVADLSWMDADLLTVWPTQHTVTWSERLVVPLMALAILSYLPIIAVHYLPWPAFAAANGQCLCFRRTMYNIVGGHAAVAGEVVEDVVLARRVKAAGGRLRMADGNRRIACRMYTGWPAVRDGFAKNILSGHAGSVLFLLLSTLFHWLVFLLPWILMWFDWRFAVLAAAGVLVRGATARFTHQRVRDALFMPLSVVLMTLIAARAIWWHWRGGPVWKGRVARV